MIDRRQADANGLETESGAANLCRNHDAQRTDNLPGRIPSVPAYRPRAIGLPRDGMSVQNPFDLDVQSADRSNRRHVLELPRVLIRPTVLLRPSLKT